MTTRTTKRPPGEPTWMDLATPDLDAAKEFYRQVFGWDYFDTGADFGHYQYALWSRGAMRPALARCSPMRRCPRPGQSTSPPMTRPPMSSAVKALGGQVIADAMEIGDSGTMAICVDPTGAVFGLWQANEHIGAGVENEHGGMTWHEVEHARFGCGARLSTANSSTSRRTRWRAWSTSSCSTATRWCAASCRWTTTGKAFRPTGWAISPWMTPTPPWSESLRPAAR